MALYPSRICVIGAGYVGGPTGAIIAKHCPSVTVEIVDINADRISSWNSERLPIYEPGLQEVVSSVRDQNLFFTTDVEGAIKRAEMIFIAVHTPAKNHGDQGEEGYDLTAYESASRTIAKHATRSIIVVEKSTVPVRTAERIRTVFEANKRRSDINFEVISNPEFLAEGTAIVNLEDPSRILIGGLDTPRGKEAVCLLSNIYRHWVSIDRIVQTGLWSAEISKLASNAFLAQRVSSINAMSSLCEQCGANVSEVASVLAKDDRIGPKFLNAGVGFGGSCFGKDLNGLVYLYEYYNLGTEAEYWRQVIKMNMHQKDRFAKLIVQKMFGTIRRKKIGLFGFAFKKDTADIRESPAIDITRKLLLEGAHVQIYDPKVSAQDIHSHFPSVEPKVDVYEAAVNAHAIVILTEWDEFKTLNYANIYRSMEKPAFVFDGRNFLDHEKLRDIGFKVFTVGSSFC